MMMAVYRFSCISGYVGGNADVPPTDETGSTYLPPIVNPLGK